MGPGPPPRRPAPLSGSAGMARSSQRWGQPRSPGVSAPGPGQGSGEDRWPPCHAGLGSARPWGVSFSSAGSWGESRGCLDAEGSSGPWAPHAAILQLPSCRPPTAYVHPAFVRPRVQGSVCFRLQLGPGKTTVGEKGAVFMLRQDHGGVAGVTRPGPQPSSLHSTCPLGEVPSQPHTEVISARLAPTALSGPMAEGEEGSGVRPLAPLGRLESGGWVALL